MQSVLMAAGSRCQHWCTRAAGIHPASGIRRFLGTATFVCVSLVTIFSCTTCFRAMDVADKASLASKRVWNIIETMTFNVYRYISRCVSANAKRMYWESNILKHIPFSRTLLAWFLSKHASISWYPFRHVEEASIVFRDVGGVRKVIVSIL